MTGRYAVLGDPVSHSLSPLIHQSWIEDHGLDVAYDAICIAPGVFDRSVGDLCVQGYVGFNVTLPHKISALNFADTKTADAAAIGAANTLSYNAQTGRWSAANTDAPGFIFALERILGDIHADMQIIVLGAGGAARAVVYALAQKTENIRVLNRTVQRAENLCTEFGLAADLAGPIEALDAVANTETILINTTSAGHTGEGIVLPHHAGRLFYDISYGAAVRGQLELAQSVGWPTADGLSMLVAQAAESFAIWFGIRPDYDKALLRCRNALLKKP